MELQSAALHRIVLVAYEIIGGSGSNKLAARPTELNPSVTIAVGVSLHEGSMLIQRVEESGYAPGVEDTALPHELPLYSCHVWPGVQTMAVLSLCCKPKLIFP